MATTTRTEPWPGRQSQLISLAPLAPAVVSAVRCAAAPLLPAASSIAAASAAASAAVSARARLVAPAARRPRPTPRAAVNATSAQTATATEPRSAHGFTAPPA